MTSSWSFILHLFHNEVCGSRENAYKNKILPRYDVTSTGKYRVRHKSFNTPLSHELRARCVQQAVRGIKGVNRFMPHPVVSHLVAELAFKKSHNLCSSSHYSISNGDVSTVATCILMVLNVNLKLCSEARHPRCVLNYRKG